MNSAMTVRDATSGDLPRIVELWCDLNRQHESFDRSWTVAPNGRDRFLATLELSLPSPQVILRVAVDENDVVVGYCHGIVKMQPEFWTEPIIGMIVSICVDGNARSTGVGARLLGAVIDSFRDAGIERVETLVSSANDSALRFWSRSSFAPHSNILSRRIG